MKKKKNLIPNSKPLQNRFFAQFSSQKIFELWAVWNPLLEIAEKLSFNDSQKGLARIDYEYIELIRDHKAWYQQINIVNRKKETEIYHFISIS